jgi:hypothetical protein
MKYVVTHNEEVDLGMEGNIIHSSGNTTLIECDDDTAEFLKTQKGIESVEPNIEYQKR